MSKLVIDIDEEEYRAISINKGVPYHLSHVIGNAILNGKPLDDIYVEWAMKEKNGEKVIGTDVCSFTDKVCIDKDCRICGITDQTAAKQEE